QDQQADDLLAGFASRRAERVSFLRSLGSDDLRRTGTHPEQGIVSIVDAIVTLAQNDAQRYRQIEANLETFQQRQNSTSSTASR
ncbi:DinB family protein, partial [Salmonella enterica]|uniref:DinB family protein n=1 Tax=Salmonella enterica TaxID=28901 RepID=UPI0039EB7280